MAGIKEYVWALYLGLAVGLATTGALQSCNAKYYRSFPKVEQVQAGHVAPSKIEQIACEDLDHNGEKETLVKIEGKSYLLMYQDGKPTLVEYSVKPAEVVPQK